VALTGLAQSAPLDVSIEEKINTTVNMSDISGGAASFTYSTNVTGYINVTNKGTDYLYDVWVAIDLANNANTPSLYFENASSTPTLDCSSPFDIPSNLVDGYNFNYSNADCILHIPLLKPNEVVSIFYDVDDSAMNTDDGSPFIISERYSASKVPANRDVSWKVYLNVSLNETWLGNTALPNSLWCFNLSIEKYLSNQSNHFGSENWTSLGPISNPSTNKGSTSLGSSPYVTNTPSNTKLNIDNICLNNTADDNKYVNITFNVTGNNTGVAGHNYLFEPFGFATFNFNLCNGGNVSGTKILDVFAIGNASVSANKTGPNYNSTIGDYVDWNESATFKNTANGLVYVLTNLSLWAVNTTGGFPDMSDVISGSEHYNLVPDEETPNYIGPGSGWATQNYTFQNSKVPVVWANVTFKLIESQNQGWWANNTTMNDYNATYGSNYIVIERIYVIGTYLIKVTKHVLLNQSYSDKNATYDVYLVVENIGGQKSPYVYVYDMIPDNFSKHNWDGNWTDKDDGNWINDTSMFVTYGEKSNPMSGYSFGVYWGLNPLEPNADGDGNYTDWNEISNNQSVIIFYQINGTGDYRLLDAFVVGIDPVLSINEQTSPKITIVSGSAASNYEVLFAMLATSIALVAIVRNGRQKQ